MSIATDRWTPLVSDKAFIVINSGEELGPLTVRLRPHFIPNERRCVLTYPYRSRQD